MNKYTQGMKEIEASEELKSRITRNVVQQESGQRIIGQHACRYRFFSLVAITAALIIVALFGIPLLHPNTDSSHPGQLQTLVNGFAITVYAADGQPIDVKPDVQFPIGQYRLTNSRAPGFPILVAADGADEIQVKASKGSLLMWSPPDYVVHNQGTELTIEPGDTLYWSPMAKDNLEDIPEDCRLALIAFKDNQEIGSAQIEIHADEAGVYTGKLIEN